MSTGGIFQLITNDGKQDRMLMATALLNKRLMEIERARASNPQIKDPTPTLVDIERTHILFMNAHFKPFAAIGYEYNKVQVQSGTARLGAEGVQYSIPQFGDFFNDMVLHLKLSSVQATNADYWTDPVNNPATGSELLRYVDYLGQRTVKNVKFTVNQNPLDEYGSDVYNFHQKFFVTPNKEVGWKRGVAQEVAKKGFVNGCGTAGQVGRGAGYREGVEIYDGAQTAKVVQPEVEMWVPLLFWFNKDPRLAIPSVSIPYGQRFIEVNFANANEILQHVSALGPEFDSPATNPVPTPELLVADLYINNIFVNPEIHDIFIKRIGFSLIRVHRRQTTRTTKSEDNILLQQMKWPIETLYVGLRPIENINVADTKMLQSWHMYAKVNELQAKICGTQDWLYAADIIALVDPPTAAEWDIALGTSTFMGYTVPALTVWNPALVNPTISQVNAYLSYHGLATFDLTAFADPNSPTALEINAAWPQQVERLCCVADYDECVPTITKLGIQAHGVPLYRDIPAAFFNLYVPYTYGGQHIRTPDDCGALMITFNLYPGSYQPSGHVNISRAREFYFDFTSAVVDTNNPADLVVIGIAINFLLISDGSAVLRYST